MSLYGWYLWTRVDPDKQTILLQITKSTLKDWRNQLLFFAGFYVVIYFSLVFLVFQLLAIGHLMVKVVS
jgi:nicotinamide riboside transporter PnuC